MAEQVLYVKTADLSEKQLDEICLLKMEAWPYPLDRQRSWIAQHNATDDVHVLYYRNADLAAYLFSTRLALDLDGRSESALGIGNVIVKTGHRKTGLGIELLRRFQSDVACGAVSLLLCKDALVPFYQKGGWTLFSGETYCDSSLLTCACMYQNGTNFDKTARLTLDKLF